MSDQVLDGELVACSVCGEVSPELVWSPDPYAVEFPEDCDGEDFDPRWWCPDCWQDALDAI